MSQNPFRTGRLIFLLLFSLCVPKTFGVVRDGGVDPSNLGQGGWLYIMPSATNHMSPNNIPSVTNNNSLFQYLKSQNLSYVIVKAGTSNFLWTGSGNVTIANSNQCQFNAALVTAAHNNGLKIFASNRSTGYDVATEVQVADYCFNVGADGYIYDAESEWESSNAWIGTNGSALAWSMCSQTRSNWPTKFIAHNPYDTLYLHSSFPYKEFGYWTDCVMPQVYHHSATKSNAFAAIHWTDVNYRTFQNTLATNTAKINGQTIAWTNALKPLVLMRDIYDGGAGTPVGADSDVRNFLDYLVADPNCVTAGGYQGSDYFRSELHSPGQWANIKAATIGVFSNVVNNIVLDDNRATRVGTWTAVKTIDATTGSTVTFSGAFGTDTDSFGTNYWQKAQGTGTGYAQYIPTILASGDYLVQQWHPTRPDASTGVSFVIKNALGTNTVVANQQTNNGDWTDLGQFTFLAGTNSYIRVMDNVVGISTNVAMLDALKLIFVPPLGVPSVPASLLATAISTSQINLSWTDTSSNETGFIIARSIASGGPYTDFATNTLGNTSCTATNLSTGVTYYFVVRAINYLGASANASEVSQATFFPPTITAQPLDQSLPSGGSATFSVSASGNPAPSYQWRFNSTNLSGATNTSYTRTNIQSLHAGSYTVVITNITGSITSAPAILTVLLFPSITSAPGNLSLAVGANASFSVVAGGATPFSYQWRFNNTAITDATNSAYLRTNVHTNVHTTDAGTYSVTITNAAGSVSTNALLTVNNPPALFAASNLTVHAGAKVTVTNTAADSDFPAQSLTFNLTTAPVGAAIAGSTGIFTWLTADTDLNTTNPVTVRVIDSGNPALSATNTFTVTVVQKPTLQETTLSHQVITLNWTAIIGDNYRVQYKTNIEDTTWVDLATVPATNTIASCTDSTLGSSARYYRILLAQ